MVEQPGSPRRNDRCNQPERTQQNGFTIKLVRAVNCWVRRVESDTTHKGHVVVHPMGQPGPVIDLMETQRGVTDMGGTMRLGLYPCNLQPGTKAAQAYLADVVQERHRHRFEFNNAYRPILHDAGLRYSGLSPDGRLVEIAELANHPFMLGTQFHPEFLSRPNRPHPLFVAFLKAVRERAYPEFGEEKRNEENLLVKNTRQN